MCLSFAVRCNYDIRVPNLQPRLAMSQSLGNNISQALNAVLTSPTRDDGLKLESLEKSLSLLERFRLRTVLSIGPPILEQRYKNEVYRLTTRVTSCSFSYTNEGELIFLSHSTNF